MIWPLKGEPDPAEALGQSPTKRAFSQEDPRHLQSPAVRNLPKPAMFLRLSLFMFLLLAWGPRAFAEEDPVHAGAEIFRNQCAECHGTRGQGVEDEYDEPLYGDLSVAELARVIHKTMPDYAPEECADEDAEKVARYVHETFYSAEARARNKPVRIELTRLTATQYEQSVADLAGSFRRGESVGDESGLRARYYNDRRPKRDKLSIERVDPEIRFHFGTQSPDPETIEDEAFAIRWEGALIVEESGIYEFCVNTENGFKFFLNNHADKPLIDGWVSSGELVEERTSLALLGGRAYPIRLEYFKFQDESASIELRWKPPGGEETVIPKTHLAPDSVAPVMVVQTAFPPDDRSMGYVRGTAVSKAWHDATTAAAIEVADYVVGSLDDLVRAGDDDDDEDSARGRRNRRRDSPKDPEAFRRAVQDFAHTFVERAFRRPLTREEKQFFVEDRFQEDVELEVAVKRIVMLALKSPRFLFPEAVVREYPDHAVAARLALALRDTLPDEELRRAADEGRLHDRDAVEAEARRMLVHPQTRLKVRGFFDHWLHLDEEHDLSKDPELYPDFQRKTIADFRHSLNLFIDEIVWSEKSDYRQLMLADYLHLNGRLANFLGHSTFGSEDYRKVHFDPQTRAGVLTHPYLLARFSYHQTTSPIHRGVFMTRNVLGRSLKPPPEAVKFEESRFEPHLTMREKVTELTKADSCMTCHAVINPLGFSLEHFDAVGRYRFEEKDRPIDAESQFKTLEGQALSFRGARDVARHAANSPTAQRGFIQHLFEHLIKQPVNAYGTDTLDRLHEAFVASDFSIQELMIEIVTLAALPKDQQNQADYHDDKNT